MNKQELLSCPFCGGEATVRDYEKQIIGCTNISCVATFICATVKQWNTRPTSTLTDAKDKRITKERKKYIEYRWDYLIKEQGNNLCFYCGITKARSIDHVTPLSKGGQDILENNVISCDPCNNKKGDRLPTGEELLKMYRLKALSDSKDGWRDKPCDHVWSDPSKDAPPVFCFKCGSPKVRISDIKIDSKDNWRDAETTKPPHRITVSGKVDELNSIPCLLLLDDGVQVTGVYMFRKEGWAFECGGAEYWQGYGGVKYWQPLPNPPIKDEE